MSQNLDPSIQGIYRSFLNRVNPAVRSQLARSELVSVFMQDVNKKHRLSKQQRLRIVDQALVLFESTYVHLPLKRAIHAVDPVQRLKLLRFRLAETKGADLPEIQFHREMQEIFASIRDIHTQYSLPTPFDDRVAYLPFLVEEYYEKNDRGVRDQKFMVSHVADGFEHPSFKHNVEVLYWNGVPIKRAIESNGERQAGSNFEARFARGLDAMTIRPLGSSLPPDEEWVTIKYRTPRGAEYDITLDWLVVSITAGRNTKSRKKSGAANRPKLAIDRHKASINHMRKILYAPKAVEAEKLTAKYRRFGKEAKPRDNAIETRLPTVFSAERKKRGGRFGYIRIYTFAPDDDDVSSDEIVDEFIRLLKLVPRNGLIIDVRGNQGGFVNASEQLLQLFTPHPIKPELFEFINTPVNLQICGVAPKFEEMSPFAKSISEAVITSASYSDGFPLTHEEDCNSRGQMYYGPVVLITDALCYSATDIFTAGFQDNNIGKVLGTSGNTGAGGAEVVSHDDLTGWMRKVSKSPFKRLPKGAGMSVAIRRSLRVGERAGRPLEELGVAPNLRHYMTKDDLRYENRDLISQAVSMLWKKPVPSIELASNSDRTRTLIVTTGNIARLEAHLNNRPLQLSTVPHKGSKAKFTANVPRRRNVELLLEGFDRKNKLVAMLRTDLERILEPQP
jgi:C-terminal processing protease CtpA/Prc